MWEPVSLTQHGRYSPSSSGESEVQIAPHMTSRRHLSATLQPAQKVRNSDASGCILSERVALPPFSIRVP